MLQIANGAYKPLNYIQFGFPSFPKAMDTSVGGNDYFLFYIILLVHHLSQKSK